ncbi:MAG: phosphatase PAP2 family protein [Chlorobiaceae bacterium]
MTPIEQADVWLFQLVNLRLVHPAADDLMVFLTRGSLSWPILFIAALFIIMRKGREGVQIVLLALLAVGLSDFIASGIFKPLVHRSRPCFSLEHVRLLITQVHSYSFASSHAANSAAVATTAWIFFHRGPAIEKLFSGLMILYAMGVAYSRVYVGVHYPGDVLAGIVIGIFSAALSYLVFSYIVKNIVQPHLMRRELPRNE